MHRHIVALAILAVCDVVWQCVDAVRERFGRE
jgi:hypothetical protein